VRAKAEGHGWQLLTKFCFRFRTRGSEEPLVPFTEEVRNPVQLRHKEVIQLAHGALSFVDGFPHELDAAFGFFDGPLERISVLTDDSQQLLA